MTDEEQNRITNFIEMTLRHRRWREQYLPAKLLSEPGWDMMLDLYLNERRGKRPITVSSLCLAAHVPATTALRWITRLEKEGLIERQRAPSDRRSSILLLTDKGRAAMEAWARKIVTRDRYILGGW